MLLRSLGVVVLANGLLAAQALPVPAPEARMLRLIQFLRPDGTQQVWEISHERLLALPAPDPKATRMRLSLVDAIGIAERHTARQNPNVKSWQVVDASLRPLASGSTLATWYYRVQLASEVESPESLFRGPPGEAWRTTVVVLLDGSVVEPAILKSATAQGTGGSPVVPGTADVYQLTPGSGIVPPKPANTPKPRYTPEAMRRRIQGNVSLQCVVNLQGRCEDLKVVRSLDDVYGL